MDIVEKINEFLGEGDLNFHKEKLAKSETSLFNHKVFKMPFGIKDKKKASAIQAVKKHRNAIKDIRKKERGFENSEFPAGYEK